MYYLNGITDSDKRVYWKQKIILKTILLLLIRLWINNRKVGETFVIVSMGQ